MSTRFLRRAVAGSVLWAAFAVACSSGTMEPPDGPLWTGAIGPREAPRLDGRALAIAWDFAEDSETLYRVDPRTLRLHRGLPLGVQALREWDLSPDGRRLLLVTSKGHVRVVDLGDMRDEGRFALNLMRVVDVAWVDDDVAILVVGWRDRTRLVRFRPTSGEVLDSATVDVYPFATEHAAGGIALLGYEPHPYEETWDEPGAVTFAVMDASGELGVRRIPQIRAGYYGPTDDGKRVDPDLALAEGRAVVVGADGTVVAVDLDDLSTTEHEPEGSLLDSLAAWFVPAAHAKNLEWTTVEAEFLTDGRVLVSGYRAPVMSPDDGAEPGGAAVVDLADGRVQVFEPDANDARAAGDLVLTWRRHMAGDERGGGIGLVAYDRDGNEVWHVMQRGFLDVLAIHDGVAFLQHGWDEIFLTAVDVDTGAVLKRRALRANVLAL